MAARLLNGFLTKKTIQIAVNEKMDGFRLAEDAKPSRRYVIVKLPVLSKSMCISSFPYSIVIHI